MNDSPSHDSSPVRAGVQRAEVEVPRVNPAFYAAVRFSALVACKLFFRLRCRGVENTPPDGPLLVVSNHNSHLDPPLVAVTLRRHLRFLAKTELFRSRLFGKLIEGCGAFPIQRGGGDREAMRKSLAMLEMGEALLMFPEGTRSLDGKPRPAQTGIAMMIARVPQTNILPVRIDGSFRAFGPGQRFPRPRPITVTVGKPFRLADLGPLPQQKKSLYQEIGIQVMQRILQAESAP